jgi:linoleoyl-CoA desaturase
LSVAQPRFPAHSPLRAELNAEVDAYFERTGLDPAGGRPMWMKTLVIGAWLVTSYLLLLFVASTWWAAGLLCASLGLAIAGVGFSVMHDANHGSYSASKRLNKLAAATIDLVGGSSFMWRHKHNVLHHTYTNVHGMDDDIELRPFLRLTVDQRRFWFHRFQWFYWVPLFVFFTTKWWFVDDFVALIKGKTGKHPFPRPRGWDLAQLFGGKLFFIAWGVVLPLTIFPWQQYLAGYVVVSAVCGITLGTVFQLAHAVDNVTFTRAPLELSWVEHQVATTTDFARDRRLLTWYVGGLNFQVEHHLFPRVGHRHYPALAPIVREVCARHGVAINDHASVTSALRSHLRFLARMGAPTAPTAAAAATTTEPTAALV